MIDEFERTLRAGGHRVTRPRQAVWRTLRSTDTHLTADEVADRLGRERPPVNRASVYRALSVLSELGLVRESRLGDTEASRWEVSHPDEHFHVICEVCGRVTHHVGTLVEQIRAHLTDRHDFTARTVELTVTGRCADCR